jgi:hypothetical protein
MRPLVGEESPDEHGLSILFVGVNIVFGVSRLHTFLQDLSIGGADGQDLGVIGPSDLM